MRWSARKNKKDYEEYLNDMFRGQDLYDDGRGKYSYMNSKKLLRAGKMGTALRKHDPVAFEVGFREWRP